LVQANCVKDYNTQELKIPPTILQKQSDWIEKQNVIEKMVSENIATLSKCDVFSPFFLCCCYV
jgi:hypothetical protein